MEWKQPWQYGGSQTHPFVLWDFFHPSSTYLLFKTGHLLQLNPHPQITSIKIKKLIMIKKYN